MIESNHGKWSTKEYVREISSFLSSSGVDASQYRDTFLMRRIEIRIKKSHCQTHEAYLRLLKEDSSEQAELIRLISVNVTEFFRDREFYRILRMNILPELRRKVERQGHLTLWSAGCATGEEPYSVTMLLMETMKDKDFEILATDRSPSAIQIAVGAMYKINSVRKVPTDLLTKYFRITETGLFAVTREVREKVRFFVGDISKIDMAQSFDVILCRNVMIYMSKGAQFALLERFSKCLNRDGYLVLGQSEMVMGEAGKLFRPLFPFERIYSKRDGVTFHQAVSS